MGPLVVVAGGFIGRWPRRTVFFVRPVTLMKPASRPRPNLQPAASPRPGIRSRLCESVTPPALRPPVSGGASSCETSFVARSSKIVYSAFCFRAPLRSPRLAPAIVQGQSGEMHSKGIGLVQILDCRFLPTPEISVESGELPPLRAAPPDPGGRRSPTPLLPLL